MRSAVLGVLALSSLAFSHGAVAQGSPSADSIINSLMPRSNVPSTQRGLRPLAPGAGATTPQPAIATEHPVTRATRPAAAASAPSSTGAAAATTLGAAPGTGLGGGVSAGTGGQASASVPSVNLTVQFATDSAMLTPAAVRTLNELGRALSSNQLESYRFRIEGHTDKTGSAAHNKTLSELRAQAVVDFLVTHFNLDRSRLEPVGMGENDPLVSTPNNVSEPRNRRVTVINVGA